MCPIKCRIRVRKDYAAKIIAHPSVPYFRNAGSSIPAMPYFAARNTGASSLVAHTRNSILITFLFFAVFTVASANTQDKRHENIAHADLLTAVFRSPIC